MYALFYCKTPTISSCISVEVGPQFESFLQELPHLIITRMHSFWRNSSQPTHLETVFLGLKPLNFFFAFLCIRIKHTIQKAYISLGVCVPRRGSHSSTLIKLGCRVARRLPGHVLSLTLEHAPVFNASTSPDVKRWLLSAFLGGEEGDCTGYKILLPFWRKNMFDFFCSFCSERCHMFIELL